MLNNNYFKSICIAIFLIILGSFIGLLRPLTANASASPLVSPPRVFLNSRPLQFEVAPLIENGRTLVPLRTIFEAMGASVAWDANTRIITATQGDTLVILPLDSKTAAVNGHNYTLEAPAKIVNSRTLVPLRFIAEALTATVRWDGSTRTIYINSTNPLPSDPEIDPQEKIVFLDAGHGGDDPGAIGTRLQEKDVNLAITLRVGDLLQQNGIRVEYTRIDDSFVGLQERSILANNLKAALFVSIHNNANDLSSAAGTETYFYAPADNPDLSAQYSERLRLAQALQTSMVNQLHRSNRGVKEANLSVLRNTQMPSALVEVAFISNPTEAGLLQNNDFKNQAAEAIANGIIAFMKN